MPVFEIYINKDTGFVDKVVERPRKGVVESVKGSKDVLELVGSVIKLVPEIPIIFDGIGFAGVEISIVSNPNLTKEEKEANLATLYKWTALDQLEPIEFQPSKDGGILNNAAEVVKPVVADAPPPQMPAMITVYVDP